MRDITSLRLDPGMVAALDRCAAKNDMTRSELIRYFRSVGLASFGEYESEEDARRARARKVLADALLENGVAAELGLSENDFADIYIWDDKYMMWLICEGIKKIGEAAMKKILDEMVSAGSVSLSTHTTFSPGKVIMSDSGEPLMFI